MTEQPRRFPRGFGAGCVAILSVNLFFGVFAIQPILRELAADSQVIVTGLFVACFVLMLGIWAVTMKLIQERRDTAPLRKEHEKLKRATARALPIELYEALLLAMKAKYSSQAFSLPEDGWHNAHGEVNTESFLIHLTDAVNKFGAAHIIQKASEGMAPFSFDGIPAGKLSDVKHRLRESASVKPD